jgi:hypothetical protein
MAKFEVGTELMYKWANGSVHTGLVKKWGTKWVVMANFNGTTDWVTAEGVFTRVGEPAALPHQEEAIEALEASEEAVVTDEPGLGKTVVEDEPVVEVESARDRKNRLARERRATKKVKA